MSKLQDAFKGLTRFFDYEPTGEFTKTWVEEMGWYRWDAIEQMVGEMKRTKHKFPTLAEMINTVSGIQMRMVEEENRVRENEEKITASKLQSGTLGITEFDNRCSKAIADLYHGDITRGQYLEKLNNLGLPTDPLKHFYNKRKLEISGFAGEKR